MSELEQRARGTGEGMEIAGSCKRQTSPQEVDKAEMQSVFENIEMLLSGSLQTPGNPQWFCNSLQWYNSFLLGFSLSVKPVEFSNLRIS